jgi:NTE family protein
VIGLALSGGGSRAIAFHLGCLRGLLDLGVLPRVNVLSTISGGSVIGAYYAYTPGTPFSEFETDIRQFLRQGFQRETLIELLKPWNLARCLASAAATTADGVLSQAMGREPQVLRYLSRSDMFQAVLGRRLYPGLRMSSPRRGNLSVVIGACELRTGTAFRFSDSTAGSWRHGALVQPDIDVAFAVAASAAYPLLLPAFDRRWEFRKGNSVDVRRVLLSDGGVYDNLGVSVLEPGRDQAYSIHSYACTHLIVCSAGQGQASGALLPLAFFNRIRRSFAVVHRRVQDASMQRLHILKEARRIEGFALPYLGQQDKQLPWTPADLIPRQEVIDYPTNFAPMTDAWIEKLSDRGEQLTRLLVAHYLPDICR